MWWRPEAASFVAMWLRGYVALWPCSYVALWIYDYVAIWLCGYVAILQVFEFSNSKFQIFELSNFQTPLFYNSNSKFPLFKFSQFQILKLQKRYRCLPHFQDFRFPDLQQYVFKRFPCFLICLKYFGISKSINKGFPPQVSQIHKSWRC